MRIFLTFMFLLWSSLGHAFGPQSLSPDEFLKKGRFHCYYWDYTAPKNEKGEHPFSRKYVYYTEDNAFEVPLGDSIHSLFFNYYSKNLLLGLKNKTQAEPVLVSDLNTPALSAFIEGTGPAPVETDDGKALSFGLKITNVVSLSCMFELVPQGQGPTR